MKRDYLVEPLRVVHLLHTVAHGGIETILVNWMGAQTANNLDICLVCFENPGGGGSELPFVEAAGRMGFKVLRVGWSRGKPVFRATLQLIRILRAHRAEVVHTHNVYADIVGLLAARWCRAKVVASAYVWADFGWKRNVLQQINKRVLNWVDLIVCQCHATRRELVERGLPDKRLRVAISGFECQHFSLTAEQRTAARVARGAEDGHLVLANVARFYPEKAHSNLLDAFQVINRDHPETRLWLFGVGPLEPELRAKCTALGLDHVVVFAGFTPDIDYQLTLVDVQVHPSFAEGVPLAICSGMAAGLPIVASRVGGIPEMITNGESGLLVPSAAEASFQERFIEAVGSMVSDHELRTRCARNARIFMEEHYSMAEGLRQLLEVYAEALEGI